MATASNSLRLTSLDQFRGYTMCGMLLVNFLGGYAICPKVLKHSHDYCSYADTIMPQFLFAAGFAMRLSLSKRMVAGARLPWGRVIQRIAGLALLAVAWYTFCDLKSVLDQFKRAPTLSVLARLAKRTWFQTLSHIAATSLWILPVIGASHTARVWFAVGSGTIHVFLSWLFNFAWVNTVPNGIDGGPLGFLTWAIPALCGTLACDAVTSQKVAAARSLVVHGIGIMLLGYAFSCGTTLYDLPISRTTEMAKTPFAADPVLPSVERIRNWNGRLAEPPFVPPPDTRHRERNYWMMSQRSGSLSYLTFAAGLSMVIYSIFLWASDGRGWQVGVFRTLGVNSLAAYFLHDIASWGITPLFPETTKSIPFTLAGFLTLFLIVYSSCRMLERNRMFLRV